MKKLAPLFLGALLSSALQAQTAAPAPDAPAPAAAPAAPTPAPAPAAAAPAAGTGPASSGPAAPRRGGRGPRAGGGIVTMMPANPALPNIWLIGDSTVRNGSRGDGSGGQWGWGEPIAVFFDTSKVNVVNRALGGTSSRTFYNNQWPRVLELIKPGDVVIMQFGHNDNGDPTGRGTSMRGAGDETVAAAAPRADGTVETVHTFGWYLRKYVTDTRAKDATPIVCSLIPRNRWDATGHVRRDTATHAGWAAEAARAENVGFIDLNELVARRYEAMGREEVLTLFPSATEVVHTDREGAELNAAIVVSGLKALKENPTEKYFSAKAKDIAPADLSKPAPEPVAPPATPAAAPRPAAVTQASATTTPAASAQ